MVVRAFNEIKGDRPINKKKSKSTKPNYFLKVNSGSRKLECFSRETSYDFLQFKTTLSSIERLRGKENKFPKLDIVISHFR